MASQPECDESVAAAPAAAVVITPMTFTNDNLVKIDTKDEYSTVGQIKKILGKLIPPLEGAPEGSPESISAALKGLVRAGKNPSTALLFLSFDTKENGDKAAALLDGLKSTRNRVWEVRPVTERDLTLTHKKGKRERDNVQVGDGADKGPNVAPWMNLPYETEQITRKVAHCVGILKTINKYSAVRDGALRCGSMLSGVIRSPITEGYRNNVQLSCGLTEDGQPCVGFSAAATVQGSIALIPPHGIPTVHPIAIEVSDRFMTEVFAPFAVDLPMYNKAALTGFWRKLHVRHNRDAELLLDIEYNPTNVTPDLLARVREALATFGRAFAVPIPHVENGGGTQVAKFVSLQWHAYAGTSTAPSDIPRDIIFGGPSLDQHLFDLSFALSPEAFFQVNRLGTELLLSKVAQEAQLNPESTVLLDLCCGTGTIGLCLARYVKRVIGVEMVAQAIENAKVNAVRNKMESKATYICNRVEHAINEVLGLLDKDADTDLVAILDPPRCGVHNSVLRWLRNCKFVRRVVYISCDQRALETDCEPLCKSATKQFGGMPFRVNAAFGVDLFPHTPHVEMIVALQRATEEELNTGCVRIQQPTTAAPTAAPESAAVDQDAPEEGLDEQRSAPQPRPDDE